MKTNRVRRIVVAVILVWLVAALLSIAFSAFELRRGKSALEDARSHANAQGLRNTQIDGELRRASSNLGRAHTMLANPVVAPLRLVPVAGRQLSAVTAMSGAAATVSDTGADTLAKARPLTGDAQVNRGETLQRLGDLSGDAAKRLDELDFGPRKGLIGPVADARNELTSRAIGIRNGLHEGEGAAHGAATLFNNKGTYLVLAGNNGEMRSGSGMYLSAGTLTTGNGNLKLGDFETVGNFEDAKRSGDWPPELQSLWGWLGMTGDLRNVSLSPQFDVAAPIAANIWQKSGHPQVDGVMVVDPLFLHAIITATGPVTDEGKAITANNVVRQLLFDQYAGENGDDNVKAQRREGLATVASGAFGSLNGGNWDAFDLAKQLGKASNGRHVLMWARDRAAQQSWVNAGVAGTLDDHSLMLNMVNLGGNKLDQFMKVDSTVSRTTSQTGIDMAVAVRVTDNAPSGAPGYVVGPRSGTDLSAGQYKGVLAMTVPGVASKIRFDGDPKLVVAGPDGPSKVAGVDMDLKAGETKTYTLRYSVPSTDRYTTVRASARIPATTWHYEGKNWTDASSQVIVH